MMFVLLLLLIKSNHLFLGVPSRPVGPLEVTNVTNNSADLSWKPSENDGGTPITGYSIEYKIASRTFWSNAGSCKADISTFTVIRLVEDTEYFFRVVAVNAEGESPPLETLETTRPTKKIGELIFLRIEHSRLLSMNKVSEKS